MTLQICVYDHSMEQIIRVSDDFAANYYPLKMSSDINWSGVKGCWRAELSLAELPSEHIIVPSFSMIDADYSFSFEIQTPSGKCRLSNIPELKGEMKPRNFSEHLTPHIDCWHTSQYIREAKLVTQVFTEKEPRNFLFICSIRPICKPVESSAPKWRGTLSNVTPISQMLAEEKIRHRICSPSSLAMAVSKIKGLTDIEAITVWKKLITLCYDLNINAYGSWPKAIYAASTFGVLGGIEAHADLESAEKCLELGQPVVCSIDYAKGKLRGAPLASTKGHLVTLIGIEDEQILVMDPAAPEKSRIAREYDRKEFEDAWLRNRGAGYYFCVTSE